MSRPSLVAVLTSEGRGLAADSALVFVLFALAVASDVMIVEMRGLRVSGAFFSVVLAMVLLGPAPAVAIGVGNDARVRGDLAPPVRSRRSPTRRSGRCSRSSAA